MFTSLAWQSEGLGIACVVNMYPCIAIVHHYFNGYLN